jgi:hypothetical protein
MRGKPDEQTVHFSHYGAMRGSRPAMTWLKVTDTALDDPRFVALARSARLLHFEALTYALRHNTGGLIPAVALSRVTDALHPETAARTLIEAGLWRMVEGGYQIEWLLDDQLSVGEINRQAEFARLRQQKRRRHLSGDHADCDRRFCDAAKHQGVTRDVTRDEPQSVLTDERASRVGHATPTRPDPTVEGGSGLRIKGGSAAPAPADRLSGSAVAASGPSEGDDYNGIPENPRLCQAELANGNQCSKYPIRGTRYCVSHPGKQAEADEVERLLARAAVARAEREAMPKVACEDCGKEFREGQPMKSHRKQMHSRRTWPVDPESGVRLAPRCARMRCEERVESGTRYCPEHGAEQARRNAAAAVRRTVANAWHAAHPEPDPYAEPEEASQ